MRIIRNIIFISALIFVVLSFPGPIHAEDIAVTGNGSDSNNYAASTENTSTTVQQTNTSSVTNVVAASSDTGNNSASSNANGNTEIATGNSQNTTEISNAANGSSISSENCCQAQSTQITVSGNGSNSQNTVSNSQNTTQNASLINTAHIRNTITGSANTGNNKGNNNTGNVFIKTGSIAVNEILLHEGINTTHIVLPASGVNSTQIIVSGNGVGSQNSVSNSQEDNFIIQILNSANVKNISTWDLLTGNNTANGNTGNVSILTGNIAMHTNIVNALNTNNVVVALCEKLPDKTTPPPGPGTVLTPTGGSNGGSGSGGGSGTSGNVLGAAVGNLLPATGSNMLFLTIIGNIMMFLLGMYLRLRSGRSPGFAFAF